MTQPDMRASLTNAQAMLRFLLAGNAYFTIRSKKTGKRFTYRVMRPEGRPFWFVSFLSGPDNLSNYSYLGVIDDRGFRITKKSKASNDSDVAKAFGWLFYHAKTHNILHDTVEFWHEGKCGRCGRMLTVPESIERGIGPECAVAMEAI